MEYKLVMGTSPKSLTEEVNKLIASGWKLYGSPYGMSLFNSVLSETHYHHYQAMTRTPKVASLPSAKMKVRL